MADLRWERHCWNDGYQAVAGIDEAGRGALAGPIVAAAVVFPAGTTRRGALKGIDDSKLLSASQRTVAADAVRSFAKCWSVAAVGADAIDEIGLARANRLAMELAVEGLGTDIEFALLDALTCELPVPQLGLINGDALSLSIAAASILAKTERDRMMHSSTRSTIAMVSIAMSGMGPRFTSKPCECTVLVRFTGERFAASSRRIRCDQRSLGSRDGRRAARQDSPGSGRHDLRGSQLAPAHR
jgi:ribonuclease HII